MDYVLKELKELNKENKVLLRQIGKRIKQIEKGNDDNILGILIKVNIEQIKGNKKRRLDILGCENG